MELVCFQSLDKENWGQINALINRGEWDKIFIVKNKNSESLSLKDNSINVININSSLSLIELKEEIINKLRPKIGKDFEVALSIASGNGKEHMALISALLCIPVGIRFVAYTKKGIVFIN